MIWISEARYISYLTSNNIDKIEEIVNKKVFTVKDTPLSYRQVNTLNEGKLINEDRHNKKGWRKFNVKEILYFLMVKDLRSFGLVNHQLKELSEFFLNKDQKHSSDFAIACVFAKIEITITINNKGNIGVYDPGFYVFLGDDVSMGGGVPHLRLRLNDYVNKIAKLINKPEFPIKYSIHKDSFRNNDLTPKENELLQIIRNENYRTIKISKKNGDDFLVHAERKNSNEENKDNFKTLVDILNEKDYQDINIIMKDGKIVHYKVEETIKL